jgi:hypothetical protein
MMIFGTLPAQNQRGLDVSRKEAAPESPEEYYKTTTIIAIDIFFTTFDMYILRFKNGKVKRQILTHLLSKSFSKIFTNYSVVF